MSHAAPEVDAGWSLHRERSFEGVPQAVRVDLPLESGRRARRCMVWKASEDAHRLPVAVTQNAKSSRQTSN